MAAPHSYGGVSGTVGPGLFWSGLFQLTVDWITGRGNELMTSVQGFLNLTEYSDFSVPDASPALPPTTSLISSFLVVFVG